MVRIVIATHNFAPKVGGIEHYVLELVRALWQRGVQIHVIAPASSGDRTFDAGEPYTIERYSTAAKDLDLVRRLERELRHGTEHVLCMQWTAAAPWLGARRALSGRPRTFAIQCYGKELLPSFSSPLPAPVLAWMERQTLAAATHVFAISEFTAELARAHGGSGRVHIVRPGVSAERFRAPATTAPSSADSAANRRPTLLTVARLVPRKGVDTVIRALPAVIRNHPEVRYRVVGQGPDRTRLEALASELGVARHVEFVGGVDHEALCREYSAADLFVLMSRSEAGGTDIEGFGMVCLEAQAAGVPVIAGRSGGVPDALRDGVSGLLVEPTNNEALAAVIVRLLDDPARRSAMAQAALEHARVSSWHESARLMMETLELNP